jgi:hypothetical protein
MRHGLDGGRCSIEAMKIVTGTVLDGKVVLQGEALPEGTVVTVVARDAGDTFEVPAELEPELLASIEEADRGETMTVDEVVRNLRRN